MTRKLFLLGGSDAFDVTADEFVPAAGGRDARIALLLQGGPGTQKHLPEYVRPWTQRSVSRYDVIMPDEYGKLNLDDVRAKLANATGIFIGGGHTGTYRRLYATEPVRSILRERYADGIPIAGCSAGALIAPTICTFHPGESDDNSLVAEGLGLIDGLIIGVHFTSQNTLPDLLTAMAASRTKHVWGIDDGACVVFDDEKFARVLGQAAYEIVMTDFENKSYGFVKVTQN
ncbi:MAG: cyanophycinase [Chloroflexi bacterium]|nr:cyanophycinase [Chloroflexota bacterium]